MNGAPDWQDGECCFRCRTQFTLVARRHHCRNCGNIFCAKCSSQQIPLPKLNIEKNVRVCDTCYEKIATKNDDPLTLALDSKDKEQPKTKTSSSKSSSSNKQTVNTASAPSEQELKEEEELQLALALSLSQEQLKTPQPIQSQSIQSQPVQSQPVQSQPLVQPQLNQPQHIPSQSIQSQPSQSQPIQTPQPDYHVQDRDIEVFRYVGEVQSTLEIFSNRLESCKLRNRPVANDSAIQSMFLKLNAEFQPKLAEFIKTYEDERANYERLQDKLSQIADARAALDALREEYKEKMRQQAAEAERLRQNQLATKLEAMRQKKSQMMQYQRDLALQRIRDQEMMLQQQQQQQPANNTSYQLPSQQLQQQQLHQYQQVQAPPGQVTHLPYVAPAPQTTQSYAPPSTQVTQSYVPPSPQMTQSYMPPQSQVTEPYVPPTPPQPAIDRASIAQLERQFLPNSKPEEDTPLISFDD